MTPIKSSSSAMRFNHQGIPPAVVGIAVFFHKKIYSTFSRMLQHYSFVCADFLKDIGCISSKSEYAFRNEHQNLLCNQKPQNF
jgi:hypothetical protein